MANRDYGKSGGKGMADGGNVGFFERLRAGNIDDPDSEAYKRWGAGSKASESAAAAAEPVAESAAEPEPKLEDMAPAEKGYDADEIKRENDEATKDLVVKAAPKRRTTVAVSTSRRPKGVVAGVATGLAAGEAAKEKAAAAPPAEAPKSKGFYGNAMEADKASIKEWVDSKPLERAGKALKSFFTGSGGAAIDEAQRQRATQSAAASARRDYADGGLVGGREYGKKRA